MSLLRIKVFLSFKLMLRAMVVLFPWEIVLDLANLKRCKLSMDTVVVVEAMVAAVVILVVADLVAVGVPPVVVLWNVNFATNRAIQASTAGIGVTKIFLHLLVHHFPMHTLLLLILHLLFLNLLPIHPPITLFPQDLLLPLRLCFLTLLLWLLLIPWLMLRGTWTQEHLLMLHLNSTISCMHLPIMELTSSM